jgi:hypothetical protein
MEEREVIVRLRTHRLSNEMFFRFMTENKQYYKKYDPHALGIDPLLPAYETALQRLDIAMEPIRQSPETERISALDAEFDITFAGLKKYQKSCLQHYDPRVRYAAENLEVVFHKYGNIARQPYHQELASAQNLLEDLHQRSGEVDDTNMRPWLDALNEKADNLATLLDVRTGEIAQRPDIRVIEARRDMETCYQKVTNRIEAMININGKDYVPGFFAEYNAHVTEYKNMLAQHLGRIKKDTENKE